MTTTALSDLVIVDCSGHMAGALATMVLADNGATVIKVERPGDRSTEAGAGFRVWDRGKRSIALDLRDPGDQEVLHRLVASADAVVSDLRPGAAPRLGLDHDQLAAVNPRLISVVITGFGERGPLTELPGYEGIVAARSGRMAATPAQRRDGPAFTPAPIASYGAAMLAVQGLLAAVHERRTTGRGRRVHTSLLHALVAFDMTSGHGHRVHLPADSGRIFGVMPLAFMTAATADGRWLQMCSRAPHLFRNWLRVLGHEDLLDQPGLANLPDIVPTVDELERVRRTLAEAMRTRSQEEWLKLFLAEDVGGDPFLGATEYLHHPQAIENGRVVVVDDPDVGPIRQIGPLGAFAATPSVITRGAPRRDEHRQEILAGLDKPPAGVGPPALAAGAGASRYPLEGITVLEVGYFYAAPFAMTLLTEMGARVIKVEPPTGDPARRNWITEYDKETVGKESVVADMKTPEGLRIVHQLAERADVFLHNFRPGVPERLGIGYATMAELNPRLVYVYGGCFGSTGPWSQRPGFHSSPNAIAGVGIIEGGRDNPPVNRTYADPASALATAACTLVALHARERTGEGQYVETTMLSSMAYAVAAWSAEYDGKPPDPMPDAGQHGFHALHRLYPTADGWLFVLVPDERGWARLVALDGLTSLAADVRFGDAEARRANDAALTDALGAMLATCAAAEWEAALLAAGVAAVRADDVELFDFMLNDPHMRANELSIEARLENGETFWRSRGSVEFSGLPARAGRPEPLGNATERVLGELGYSPAEIADLLERGITRPVGQGI